jgi:hypothetical protein
MFNQMHSDAPICNGVRAKLPIRTFALQLARICLPLAQELSTKITATSVIGRFVTTRERAVISRSCTDAAQLSVQPQALSGLTLPAVGAMSAIAMMSQRKRPPGGGSDRRLRGYNGWL